MLATPHAPGEMYAAEVRFYRELRPQLAIEAPRAYAGVVDQPSARFGLIMEDLSLHDAVFPNVTMVISQARMMHQPTLKRRLDACS